MERGSTRVAALGEGDGEEDELVESEGGARSELLEELMSLGKGAHLRGRLGVGVGRWGGSIGDGSLDTGVTLVDNFVSPYHSKSRTSPAWSAATGSCRRSVIILLGNAIAFSCPAAMELICAHAGSNPIVEAHDRAATMPGEAISGTPDQ